MRNLLTRLLVITTLMVVGLAAMPVVASANNDPSSPQPAASDTLNVEPPLPVTPPPTPPDPPHVPATYTVGSYFDKTYQASTDGLIKPVTVRKVEDLAYIANKLSLTTDEIKYSNPNKDVTQLQEGDQLTVPQVHGVVYTVQNGDNLTWITQAYQVDLNTVATYNNIQNPDQLSPGQVIVLPNAKLPPTQVQPTPVYSTQASSGTVPSVPAGHGPVTGSVGNHFYFGYCTYWVASIRPVPWFGDAIAWWPNARAYGYPEGQTPRVGAILVESPNHVAYVESVGIGSFTVSEMNWQAWNVVDHRIVYDNDPQIVGFIY